MNGGGLLPVHRADFERSGLSAATIEASGAYSVSQIEAKQLLGFDPGSGGWVLPYPHREGLPDEFDFKPDIPFRGSDGKSRKYLRRLNSMNRVYIPPQIPMERLQSRREVLVVTEGAKKTLKAAQEGIVCVALSGVWNWKFRDEMNDSRTIEDLRDVWLTGRDILVCFDSDLTTKPGVAAAEFQLAKKLRELGAGKVEGIRLPTGTNGEKVGLDDFLLSHTKEDLLSLYRDPLTSTQDVGARSDHLTDLGNSRRFVSQHKKDVRYVPSWGWLCWSGTCWEQDNTGMIQRKSKATVMTIYAEVMRAEDPDVRKAIARHATKSESEASIDHMIELAKTEAEIVATTDDFDRDPFLFNVMNGTIDLRTGTLQKHSAADLITKVAPVTFDPDAQCPLWEKFLHTIMGGNKTLIRYQQKSIGYALTGSTKEQKVFVHNGGGGNGKSVFINTIRNYMGPYALQSQAETFMTKNNPGIPNDLARLVGARLVTVQETEAGKRLAESLVKAVSGGDTITARFLHKEYFEFIPSFKLFLITNHRPIIRGQDYAIWRRVDLIPYSVTIPLSEQDRWLEDKLKKELSGILNWTIEGCLAWQREGLGLPEEVQSATSDYRAEQADTVYHFIIDTCKQDINGRISAKVFYEAYQTWCNDNSEDPVEQRTFKRKVQDLGFKQKKTGKNGSREWHGLCSTDGTDGVTSKTPFFLYNSSYEKNIENDVTPSVPSVNGMEPPILDGEA